MYKKKIKTENYIDEDLKKVNQIATLIKRKSDTDNDE